MPARLQEQDSEQIHRAAKVYPMRLPDSGAAEKKAPYIIHQVILGKDTQAQGQRPAAQVTVRSIFNVYNENESEGGLMLLNLMERLRIFLLKRVVIGDRYQLDLESGLDILIYPEDTSPYYSGEMASVWMLPPIEREVNIIWQQ